MTIFLFVLLSFLAVDVWFFVRGLHKDKPINPTPWWAYLLGGGIAYYRKVRQQEDGNG